MCIETNRKKATIAKNFSKLLNPTTLKKTEEYIIEKDMSMFDYVMESAQPTKSNSVMLMVKIAPYCSLSEKEVTYRFNKIQEVKKSWLEKLCVKVGIGDNLYE